MSYSANQTGEKVANAASAAGINARIAVEQIRQESNFNPNATGPMTRYGTAKGLAQFIDDTWRRYGHGSPYDPDEAIKAYVKYMTFLLGMFGGRYDLALAAYNWGENRSQLRAALASGRGILTYSIPDQTRGYVKNILERAGSAAAQPSPVADTTPAPLPVLSYTGGDGSLLPVTAYADGDKDKGSDGGLIAVALLAVFYLFF